MPTKNPKISAYVPQEIYDKFKAFQEERNLKMSQAVAVILAEYFELNHVITQSKGVEVGGVTLGRLEALEKKLEDFVDLVEQRLQDFSSSLPSEISVDQGGDDAGQPLLDILSEMESKSSSESELLGKLLINQTEEFEIKPISATKLSKLRFGLSAPSVSKAGKRYSAEEFTEWTKSKDPDGIAWRYIEEPTKGYLPVEELSDELMSKLLEWVKKNDL